MSGRAIIYHASCPDGLGAALAARLCFGPNVPCTVYLPVQYSDPVPDVNECDMLYILDFSYPAEILDAWEAAGKRVVVIDHHRTASHIAVRPGCVFNPEKSGAVLAWEYFFPGKHVPTFFQYLQDRDLWLWELPDSRAFSAGLWARPKDLDAWVRIFDAGRSDACESLITAGRSILEYHEQIVASHVKRAVRSCDWGLGFFDDKALVVNATTLISEIGEALLAAHPDAPYVAPYMDLPGDKRVWSLRSTDGRADVSEVAKARGGGGHRNAAGFSEVAIV